MAAFKPSIAPKPIHDWEIKTRHTLDDYATLSEEAGRCDKPLAVLTREVLHAFAEKIRQAEAKGEVPVSPSRVLYFRQRAA